MPPMLQGYYLRALKMMNVPKELAEEHYVDLSSKPFYKGLVNYIVRYLCYSCQSVQLPRSAAVTGHLSERASQTVPLRSACQHLLMCALVSAQEASQMTGSPGLNMEAGRSKG